MALNEISYPVTGVEGSYQNTFPSQKPLYADFERKDLTISTIVSGTDSKVQIKTTANFVDVLVGQFITFQSDGYPSASVKVLEIVDVDTIRVDLVFTSTDATNGFVNYKRNYFLELRYVQSGSASDDQSAIQIIDDFDQVANSRDGSIRANISLPAQLIAPDFDIASGIATNLFKIFKIQFRESYEGNRTGAWISPVLDIPILLVHASVDILVNDFTDSDVTKRFVKSYPLMYSLLYSSINDDGSNALLVRMKQFDIGKTEILETEVVNLIDFNGVYLMKIDTDAFEDDTRFISFDYVLSTNTAQFDPLQFDPAQFATG